MQRAQPMPRATIDHRSSSEGSGSDKGAVSGTSSESEREYDGFTIKDLSQVKWTPRLEANLEEMLIRNHFDFKESAKEFERILNKTEPRDSSSMFKVDGKTLQLRWTDIEIRRHVIPKMNEKK